MSNDDFLLDEEEDAPQYFPWTVWLFHPGGRLSRTSMLVLLPTAIALSVFARFLIVALFDSNAAMNWLVNLALLYVLAVWGIKRCHDTKTNPGLLLLALIPFLGQLFYLILIFASPGERRLNEFGPPERLRMALPCESEEDEAFYRSL